jgi:hypothetical protein
MKRIIIFLSLTIIIIASLVIILNRKSLAPAETIGISTNASEIKSEVVLAHNSANNCWVAIGGSVYKLDDYFVKNPNEVLASQLCGKIEPELKLPKDLSTTSLATYRIGILVI